jgi:hypothetical protein
MDAARGTIQLPGEVSVLDDALMERDEEEVRIHPQS